MSEETQGAPAPVVETPVAPPAPPTLDGGGSADFDIHAFEAESDKAATALLTAAREKGESAEPTPAAADAATSVLGTDAQKVETPPAAPQAPQSALPENPLGSPKPIAEEDDARFQRRFEEMRRKEQANLLAEQDKKRLQQYDAMFESGKAKPADVFAKLGWTEQDVADYIIRGQNAPPPGAKVSELERTIAELRQSQQQMAQQLQAEKASAQVDAYKAAIPKAIPSATFPHINGVYDSDAEKADAVWNVIAQAHRAEGVVLSVADAASALEDALAKQATRFSRVQPQRQTATPSASVTPKLTPQTVASRVAAPQSIEWNGPEDDAALTAEAARILRASKKAS